MVRQRFCVGSRRRGAAAAADRGAPPKTGSPPGYDPLHYAPILEDARLHGTRLVGLSPPDELLDAVTRVGSENLDRGTSAFLPTGGTDAGRRLDAEREQRLFANRRDSQQLLSCVV